MTHFTVGIIVPQDKLPHLQNFIYEQMRPYDEGLEVEPYVSYSVEQARAELDRDIDRLERIIERRDPAYKLDRCRELLAVLRDTTAEARYREYVEHHDRFNARGEPLSTSNPASKWDWWVVGGRWHGWITGKKHAGRDLVENNIAPTEQALASGVIPHAIITPDGQWHERGRMGWWAVLLTEDDDWDAKAREILAGYPGHQLLILDAHI
jgi:hypothetical protein